MKTDFARIKTFKDVSTYKEYWRDSVALENQINESVTLIEKFKMREQRLGQQEQSYPDFDELKTNFQPFYELLTTAYQMTMTLSDLQKLPLLQNQGD